jgi:hypothetical protein
LFGTKVRYSGVSLGYNLASIFAGALSPLIATWLMVTYKPATWPISVYMISLAVITLVSVYFAVETRKTVKPESPSFSQRSDKNRALKCKMSEPGRISTGNNSVRMTSSGSRWVLTDFCFANYDEV